MDGEESRDASCGLRKPSDNERNGETLALCEGYLELLQDPGRTQK